MRTSPFGRDFGYFVLGRPLSMASWMRTSPFQDRGPCGGFVKVDAYYGFILKGEGGSPSTTTRCRGLCSIRRPSISQEGDGRFYDDVRPRKHGCDSPERSKRRCCRRWPCPRGRPHKLGTLTSTGCPGAPIPVMVRLSAPTLPQFRREGRRFCRIRGFRLPGFHSSDPWDRPCFRRPL